MNGNEVAKKFINKLIFKTQNEQKREEKVFSIKQCKMNRRTDGMKITRHLDTAIKTE